MIFPDMTRITINSGLGDGSLSFSGVGVGFRTNPPAFVDFTSSERCFKSAATISGTGTTEMGATAYDFDVDVPLELMFELTDDCTESMVSADSSIKLKENVSLKEYNLLIL